MRNNLRENGRSGYSIFPAQVLCSKFCHCLRKAGGGYECEKTYQPQPVVVLAKNLCPKSAGEDDTGDQSHQRDHQLYSGRSNMCFLQWSDRHS